MTLNVVAFIFFKLYLSKRLKCLHNNGLFYLSVIVNPKSDVWYKVTPMGVNKINKIMKEMVANSYLEGNKPITNRSGTKTLVKKLKRNKVTKSDIIKITGHNNEGGLDVYGSGHELQQETLSNIIDNVNSRAAHYRSNIISPDHPSISNPMFDIFPKQDGLHFNNCTVNFNIQAKTSPKKAVKRRRVIISDDSSQYVLE